MNRILTDIPFKLRDTGIIVVKGLPVIQCESCREYLLDDAVMEQVEDILSHAGKSIELEVVKFAA
jgi:YgiT-type zinc finger domain-containing protein